MAEEKTNEVNASECTNPPCPPTPPVGPGVGVGPTPGYPGYPGYGPGFPGNPPGFPGYGQGPVFGPGPCPGPPVPPVPPTPPVPPEAPIPGNVLNLMREAAGRERRDIELYNYLIDEFNAQVQTQQVVTDGAVLRNLRAVSERNLFVLGNQYRMATGQPLEPIEAPFTPPVSYRAGLENALSYEADQIGLYRQIYTGTRNMAFRDAMFEPLMNQVFAGDRLNYLYTRAVPLR